MLSTLKFILKDASAISAAKLSNAIATLISLPIVTSSLSVKEYANYEYILLFILPLQLVIGLNIENSILRYWEEFKLGHTSLARVMLLYTAIFLVLFGTFVVTTGILSITTILLILAFVSLCWQTLCLYIRLCNNLIAFYLTSVVPNVAWITYLSNASRLNVDTILLSKSAFLFFVTLVSLIITLKLRLPIANSLNQTDYTEDRKIIIFSVSLIPSIIVVWLLNVSDRYLISMLKLDQDLAIYSLHFRIAMGFKLFVAVARQTWSKLFFATNLLERSNKTVNMAINFVILSVIIIVPVYLLFSGLFVDLFIVNSYSFDVILMLAILISLSISILYTISCTMYLNDEKISALLCYNLLIASANYVFSYTFINLFGVIGAPLGSILSLGIMSVIMQWYISGRINYILSLTMVSSFIIVSILVL